MVDAAISGVFTGITTGVQTGDIEQAIKAAALSASEDCKCGAIIGAVAAGAAEGAGLLKASKYAKKAGEAGLTMSEAAKVQLESGLFPPDDPEHEEHGRVQRSTRMQVSKNAL